MGCTIFFVFENFFRVRGVRVRIKLGVLFEDAGYIPLVTYSYKRVILIHTLEKTKQRL